MICSSPWHGPQLASDLAFEIFWIHGCATIVPTQNTARFFFSKTSAGHMQRWQNWRQMLIKFSIFDIMAAPLLCQCGDVSHFLMWHKTILANVSKSLNTLRPRQDGCHFGRWHFQMYFLEWKCLISIRMSLMFVPEVPIYNKPSWVR